MFVCGVVDLIFILSLMNLVEITYYPKVKDPAHLR